MEGATSQSTPTQSRKSDDSHEMFKMIQVMLEKHTININNRFDSNEEKFDNKFDKLSREINEQKVKCESNFNELKKQNNELKNDINEINKHLEKTNEILETNFNRLEQSIEKVVESVEEQIKSKATQIINNKVSDDCKTSENYNDMCKNVVLESKVIKEDVEVEFSNEVLLESADESER